VWDGSWGARADQSDQSKKGQMRNGRSAVAEAYEAQGSGGVWEFPVFEAV
jgi:hypothetical protein